MGTASALAAWQARSALAASEIPIDLQARLTAKAAAYDRNMQARAGARIVTMIVYTARSPASVRARNQLASAFESIGRIAGLPVDRLDVNWREPTEVVAAVKSRHVALMCLTPGLDDHVAPLVDLLSDADLLTMSVEPSHVHKGVVLGFKAVSARPTMLVNLEHAKRQNVDFRAEFLKLAEVIR